MHIADGILSPTTQIVTGLISVAAIGLSVVKLRASLEEKLAPMIGVMAAGIFAGQMVNFWLPPLPASGHLMGGVLAAVVLGPWGAILALANVLLVQCFLYADGGPASLGANLFNMGIIGGALGYAIYDPLRRWIGGAKGTVFAAVFASWAILPISALAFSVELAVGGAYPFSTVATSMLFYHVLIGIGEALITGLVVSWIVAVRPDLIYQPLRQPGQVARVSQAMLGGLAVAASVVLFLAPLASGESDGLERVGEELGFVEHATAGAPAPFPDYELTKREGETVAGADVAGEGQPMASGWLSAANVTRGLGLLGTAVTFVLGIVLAQSVRGAPRARPAHAA